MVEHTDTPEPTPPPDVMIAVDDLSKAFGPITAVDHLSFSIATGEVVGFLGPNGAGKTTAMRLITGYYAPDSGAVTVAGIPVLERAIEAQRMIGYLPENNPIYKDMLVSEFLGLSADLKRIPKRERRPALDFVVGAVGIDDVYYRPIGQLSKGYKQRVGIAVALIHKPRILIMDEPTEGLDPNQRSEIRALIKDLAEDRTIVMSTHVMQEAQAVCNRVIIVNRGRVIADGSAEELARGPKNQRVIMLEVQGGDIAGPLEELDGVDSVDTEPAGEGRVLARITTDVATEIRPEISRLVRDRGWVIWRLQEEVRRLEDVFHELTSDA